MDIACPCLSPRGRRARASNADRSRIPRPVDGTSIDYVDGFQLTEDYDAFLNFRYLGGGAEGTSDSEFGDGFTKNWLHFATVSLGFTYDVL